MTYLIDRYKNNNIILFNCPSKVQVNFNGEWSSSVYFINNFNRMIIYINIFMIFNWYFIIIIIIINIKYSNFACISLISLQWYYTVILKTI